MIELNEIIKNHIPNVDKIELLPYHLLGVNKYESLNINYSLKGIPQMDKDKCKELQSYIRTINKSGV